MHECMREFRAFRDVDEGHRNDAMYDCGDGASHARRPGTGLAAFTLVPCLGFVSCFASFLHLFLLPTFLSIHVRRACASSTCRNCAMQAPPKRRSPSRRRARSPPLRFGPVIFSQKISIHSSPSLLEVSMGSIGAVRVVLVQLSNGIFDTAQRHRRVSKHAKEGKRWRWRVS